MKMEYFANTDLKTEFFENRLDRFYMFTIDSIYINTINEKEK